MDISKEKVMEWLEEVKDPEIPVLSLVDLGVITDVQILQDGVRVEMTPTFSGCPALDYMKNDVISVLNDKGIQNVDAEFSFKKPWNSDRISEKGKAAIKEFGLAPPPATGLIMDIDVLENVACPYCDSTDTVLKSPFGPTLCRSLHYCNNCLQAFEQFKPVT